MKNTSQKTVCVVMLLFIGATIGSTFAADASAASESPVPALPMASVKLKAVRTPSAGPPVIDMERLIVLQGTLTDANDRPIAGARLFLNFGSVALGVSGDDGTYRLEVPERSFHGFTDGVPRKKIRTWLIAVADGYGPVWAGLPGVERDGWEVMRERYEQDFRLVPDFPITGRIVDTDGKPVAGAEVAVAHIHELPDAYLFKLPEANLSEVEAYKTRQSANVASWSSTLPRTSWRMLPPAVTDDDGRFLIAGVGENRAMVLNIEGSGIEAASVGVITRDDVNDWTRAMRDRFPRKEKDNGLQLFGPTATIEVDRTPTVAGVVRDAVTGEPMAGVRIVVRPRQQGYPDSTRTDRLGWYRVQRKASRHPIDISFLPWDDQGDYLPIVLRVDGSEEPNEIVADAEMPHGVVVTGRVLEAGTDRPILSARRVTCDAPFLGTLRTGHVWYYPLATNTALGQSPTGLYFAGGYNRWLLESIDPDGRFRIAVPPGPGVLLVRSSPGVSGNNLLMHSDSTWKESEGLHLLSPYTPLTKREANDGAPAGTAENFDGINGPIRIEGFHAYRVISPPADAKELNLTLHVPRAPSRVLRFVGPDGDAVENVRVQGLTARSPMTVAIDDAEIEIVGLDPNQPRQVTAISGDGRLVARTFVGVDDPQPTTIRMEPAAALTGRVFDAATGQPVAGCPVYVRYPDPNADEPRLPGQPIWPLTRPVKTGDDGRFQIGGLFPDLAAAVKIRTPNSPEFQHPNRELRPKALQEVTLKAGEVRDVGIVRLPIGAKMSAKK